MADKQRPKHRIYLEYFAVRILVCVMQALSFELACKVANFLAWVVYKVDRRHRVVAQENVRQAFPGKYTEAQIDLMVRGVYRHFLTVLMEIMHLPRRLHVHNWLKVVRLKNGDRMVEALLCGRPLLIVTGHFGNWELAGYTLGLLGFTAHAIARPLDNPLLDDYLRSFRERTGQKVLAKKGDFDNMERLLQQGGVLATLADQDAGQRGVFVDFFGRPASTHKAVALMAIEHKVPMAVTGTYRSEGKYVIDLADVILPEDYERSFDAVKQITQRFSTALESLIRKAPEQYFWVHRRWKSQPQARKSKKAA